MKSPFQYGKVVEGKYFTNRKRETVRLISNFENGINTILLSPRRWGKSSLVNNIFRAVAKKDNKLVFCFIDLFNVRDESDFYATFAREVIKVTSTKFEELISIGKELLKRVRPKFVFGTDPINDFEISFELESVGNNYVEILNLPEKLAKKKKMKLIVCMDEFQNLHTFSDPLLFQKRLRSSFQHHKNVVYCFCGSRKSMMTSLFENKSMPFYKFGDVIYLKKIEKHYLIKFIINGFNNTGKSISKELANMIVDLMEDHPYYVQQLAHIVWINTDTNVSEKILEESITSLLEQNSMLFEREIEYLSKTQISFLIALSEGINIALSSAKIIKKYRLGSSANVVKIKNVLESKEIIQFENNKPYFIDPAFKLWFNRYYTT